jgi:signal transduction histidine kinase
MNERAASDEQAALHRVAALVAAGAGAADLFSAVAEEVARVVGVSTTMLARFEPEGVITVLASVDEATFAPGSRWPLDGTSVALAIRDSGAPARIDDYDGLGGTIAAGVRECGIRATAGVAITVDGAPWGLVRVGARGDEPLPADTAERLRDFTELVAIAIANAEARDRVRRLAEQQAALRRVATLAGSVTIEVLCRTVVDEIVEVLEVETASVEQAAPPGWLSVVASRNDPSFAAGTSWPLTGSSGSARVIRTGRPARVDDYTELHGEIAARARSAGLASSLSIPVLVDGVVWGVVGVGMTARQRLALDTEVRLRDFAALLATAISNERARERIGRLADEQAALRRVATRVAEGAAPEELFSAVAEEVAGILDVTSVRIFRQPSEGAAIVVASVGDAAGETSLDAPILVEDRVWGRIAVGGFRDGPPAGAGERLEAFTELVAAAIAKAQANEELRRLAREQAALGRVATLVARAAPLTEISAAVRGEQARLPELSDEALAALVATAVANAEAHNDLRALVEEQAALRRVATLVAAGASTGDLFGGVAVEVARVLGVPAALLERQLPDGSVRTLARSDDGAWPAGGAGISTPIMVDGERWGAIRVSARDRALPDDTEVRLRAFTELVGTAVSNAAARAELLASRTRIVAAGDDARRRTERDLHDGTQQRLIALGLDLQRIRATLDGEPARVLEGVERDLGSVLEDVRELSRGLHPPMLARRGLLASLRALARRSPLPVQLEVDLPERPPAAVETALYHVVVEALANAARHARASQVSVTVAMDEGPGASLHARITDDGVGGARIVGGAGLAGIADRIDALGGRLELESPPDAGTRISILLPLVPARH